MSTRRAHTAAIVLLLVMVGLQAQSVNVPITGGGGQYVSITSTALTVVKSAPGLFLGVYAPGAQVNALECWDNASSASGTVLYNKLAPQVLNDAPAFGIAVQNGIVCQQAIGVAGNVMVLYK